MEQSGPLLRLLFSRRWAQIKAIFAEAMCSSSLQIFCSKRPDLPVNYQDFEVALHFYACGMAGVPFFSMSGSEFVEMFVGMGASKVRDLFPQAKEKAPALCLSTRSMPSAKTG